MIHLRLNIHLFKQFNLQLADFNQWKSKLTLSQQQSRLFGWSTAPAESTYFKTKANELGYKDKLTGHSRRMGFLITAIMLRSQNNSVSADTGIYCLI